MAKPQIKVISQDFDGVLAFFKERGLVPQEPPSEMVSAARRLHFATYSLILWRFRLKKLPDHSRVFVEEIASDALQILPHALAGYVKTSDLLIRGVIENTLRHVYFSDHPIEYLRMNREQKWYVEVKELFEYPGMYPLFIETESKFDAVEKLKSIYSSLSGTVHGRRVSDLEMRVALKKIVFEQNAFERRVGSVEQCAEAVNFLLAAFHAEAMRGFQAEDRRIILRSMSPKARSVWSNLG